MSTMYDVLIEMPADTDVDLLPAELQAVILNVEVDRPRGFDKMPGTAINAATNTKIVHAIIHNLSHPHIEPQDMLSGLYAQFGLDWTTKHMQTVDPYAAVTEVIDGETVVVGYKPLVLVQGNKADLLRFMPPVRVYDEAGNILSETLATVLSLHNYGRAWLI